LKTIWITGGSSGIGYATALEFNRNGWRVIISSRSAIDLKKIKKNILLKSSNKEFYYYRCDISKRNEVNKTVEKIEKEIGNINIGLLNAAAYSPNKLQKFSIENFEKSIDVNLKGTLYCIESLQKKMKIRKKGHIAIVSSPVGYRGLPTAPAYGMTKAALINLAESLYFDLKKIGIKVSIINPGFIETSSTKKNTFPMPFLKPASYAGKKIFNGLVETNKFEIFFPYFFIKVLKFFRILPYPIYFFLISKITGL
tara:strand:- start:48 stop:809 length:762 start_codon:yes stop_codon:yes gene_type:complete